MKFLIIGKVKDVALTLPPALSRQLLEASLAVMNQHKKEGKILEFYFIPGARSVIIGESKTAEEMVRNFSEAPVTMYMDWEIYPLADFNEGMKTIIGRLKEAEKMMPGPPR
jgi:hypothetical protein